MNFEEKEIRQYETAEGKAPYQEWFDSLKDTTTEERIRWRLLRLEKGHFGDHKYVGGGVFELRFHFGPGYRIYIGEHENTVVLLLCGGDKKTQQRDISKAIHY